MSREENVPLIGRAAVVFLCLAVCQPYYILYFLFCIYMYYTGCPEKNYPSEIFREQIHMISQDQFVNPATIVYFLFFIYMHYTYIL